MRDEQWNPKYDYLFKDWRHYVEDMDKDMKLLIPTIHLVKDLLEANTFVVNLTLQQSGVWTNPLSEEFGPGKGPTSLDVWGIEILSKELKLKAKLD